MTENTKTNLSLAGVAIAIIILFASFFYLSGMTTDIDSPPSCYKQAEWMAKNRGGDIIIEVREIVSDKKITVKECGRLLDIENDIDRQVHMLITEGYLANQTD